MNAPAFETRLRWRAAAPPPGALRARIEAEVRAVSWALAELQVVLRDAQSVAGQHPFLVPCLEVRLPIFDAKLRYRVRVEDVDAPALRLVDERGSLVADVVLL